MSSVDRIRDQILELHRALIEEERKEYESAHGKTTPGQLLELLVSHESFAWLKPFTTLIVELDDHEEDRLDVWLVRARALFSRDAAAGDFQKRYDVLVGRNPALAAAHGSVVASLG